MCNNHPAIKPLLENNQTWAQSSIESDSEFFSRNATEQHPEYLWIGFSDSRVPANNIVGLAPGELFVHRNIANNVQISDINCLSVIQYAVDVLKVKHIVVCGHYGCGGVQAAMGNADLGLVGQWIRPIKDIYVEHKAEIEKLPSQTEQVNRLCELNVIEQVKNLAKTKTVQGAWQREQALTIHGLVYSLADGTLNDLQVTTNSLADIDNAYQITP